jgi:hypothetical protein
MSAKKFVCVPLKAIVTVAEDVDEATPAIVSNASVVPLNEPVILDVKVNHDALLLDTELIVRVLELHTTARMMRLPTLAGA